MKLQFSLATLLVCMTVLAVVARLSILPVTGIEWSIRSPEDSGMIYMQYPATAEDIARRLVLWWPVSLAATLCVLWAIRRLKSRREKGPPVG